MLVWGNQLVFHNIDKLTSLFLHSFPLILTYTWRWFPRNNASVCPSSSDTVTPPADCSLNLYTAIVLPSCAYMMWQALYLLKTEVIDAERMKKNPKLLNSIRWMTKNPTGLAVVIRDMCRATGIFAPYDVPLYLMFCTVLYLRVVLQLYCE